ncbi:hypothetical protein BZA05DRAFT_400738 [Tricharina praecox]|uniref:uncharacterized protein n=1 Tax=Tricharina praecox TaxID=43433 RepID=UPI00221E7C7E|nr:uncharacterized protein BZA05DRAFT_400738 [Tricharina praecox]KAI5850050.1 hypothetical protein BZA05DRAFT_400738 [Tricharina praecox]
MSFFYFSPRYFFFSSFLFHSFLGVFFFRYILCFSFVFFLLFFFSLACNNLQEQSRCLWGAFFLFSLSFPFLVLFRLRGSFLCADILLLVALC